MESARCPPPRNPSPTTSAASKGEKQRPNTAIPETSNLQEVVEEGKAVSALQCTTEKVQTAKTVDASEATHESMSVKEAASQGSAPVVEEEVQQKLGACEPGNNCFYNLLQAGQQLYTAFAILFFFSLIFHAIQSSNFI